MQRGEGVQHASLLQLCRRLQADLQHKGSQCLVFTTLRRTATLYIRITSQLFSSRVNRNYLRVFNLITGLLLVIISYNLGSKLISSQFSSS